MLTRLDLLVTTRQVSVDLIAAGIRPHSSLWWVLEEEDVPEEEMACVVQYDPFLEYDPARCVPAWTKEEIDVMIGGDYSKPDQKERSAITPGEIPLGTKPWDYIPTAFMVALPERILAIDKGADASATMLIEGIRRGLLKPGDCFKRYEAVYKIHS